MHRAALLKLAHYLRPDDLDGVTRAIDDPAQVDALVSELIDHIRAARTCKTSLEARRRWLKGQTSQAKSIMNTWSNRADRALDDLPSVGGTDGR